MTPAITALQSRGIGYRLLTYPTTARDGFGDDAVAKLGLDPARVFKTLVVQLDGGTLAVALVPVDRSLQLKSLAQLAGARSAAMAPVRAAEAATGYRIGGISPLGQRRALPTFVDHSALSFATVYVSGGRRGYELELAPTDLIATCQAMTGAIATSD